MNSQERHGKWIFLTLAAYLAVERIVETGLTLSHGLAMAPAIRSVALAFLLIVALMFLWRGENTLRWLIGVWCLLSGGMSLVVSSTAMIRTAAITPPELVAFKVARVPQVPKLRQRVFQVVGRDPQAHAVIELRGADHCVCGSLRGVPGG